MKKLYSSLFMLGISLILIGCSESFPGKGENDKKSEANAYTRHEEANRNVATARQNARYVMRPLVQLEHFSSSVITDECETSNTEGNISSRYNQGDRNPNVNSSGNNRQLWNSMFATTRHINLTLKSIEKYKTPDNLLNPGSLDRCIDELYLLRGYMHLRLMIPHREIPYIDHNIPTNGKMGFKQESMHAVADRIMADAEAAYVKVAEMYNRSDGHFRRVNKGVRLGLIAIARRMVVTPLYNGVKEHGYEGNHVFESEYIYKAEHWTVVKDVIKKVIDFRVNSASRYSLYTKYDARDFRDDDNHNLNGSLLYHRLWDTFYNLDGIQIEGVFFVAHDKNNWWQGDQYAPSRGGGPYQQPVQEQVDEYEYMASDNYGYSIYSQEACNAGYDDANPYIKHDPHSYRDIIYHGIPYRDNGNHVRPMNTAKESDQTNANNATTTDCYLRKFMKDGYNKSGGFDIRSSIVWRLPKSICIYTEAVNETSRPNQEIHDMINKVCAHSFMSPIPPTTMTNKRLIREYIECERHVEFFYGSKRLFERRLYPEPSFGEELVKEEIFLSSGADNTQRPTNYQKRHKGVYSKCQHMINGMRLVEDPADKIEISGKHYRMEHFCRKGHTFETPEHYLSPTQSTELNVCPTLIQNPGQ